MSTVIGTNSRGGIAKSAKNASSKASNRTGIKTSTASSTPTNNATQLSSLQSQLSSKIQEAKQAGLNTTKAESFLGSSYAKSSGASDILTSENTKPAPTITLPKMGTLPSLSDIVDINNANLGGSTYNTSTRQFDMTQSGQTQPQNQLSALAQYLNSNQQAVDNTQSNETLLKQNRKLYEKQQNKVNSLQAQVNTITSNRDAAILALEGQGRGQTSGFIGGEQARISREAAIQALPIQAQLAAAQDDLDSARTYASQLFQAQSQDAQAKLQYQKEVNATIYQYLTDEQKRIATANEKKADREYATTQDNRAMLEKLVLTAIDNGQASKIGAITTIDPSSKTFLQDYARVAGTVNKYISTESSAQISPENLIAYAQEYAATGKIPTGMPKGTFGVVAQVAKESPKQHGEIVSTATGVKPNGDNTYVDAMGSLTSAVELAKQLKELDKERIGGIISGTLGKIFGSSSQQKYVDLQSQIVDLLSRARSGAALNASEEKRYSDMLPGRFSEPLGLGADSDLRIQNFIDALSSDLKQKASSKGLSIYGYSSVTVGGNTYTVGDIITNASGQKGRVNPDGSITLI